MMRDLFDFGLSPQRKAAQLGDGAWHLPDFAGAHVVEIVDQINQIATTAPFRHLVTPGGRTMSVAMTCCGTLGWHSDRFGYRYVESDPMTERPWPAIPKLFLSVAQKAAQEAGFPGFRPQACLINRYVPGARLTLHQDRDEDALCAPIVSISLGLAATFLWGGAERNSPLKRIRLQSGDVVVWGGSSRLVYHGVAPLAAGSHPITGEQRLNLTFRQVRK